MNVQTGINTARVEVEEPVAVEGWAMGVGREEEEAEEEEKEEG